MKRYTQITYNKNSKIKGFSINEYFLFGCEIGYEEILRSGNKIIMKYYLR